MAQEVSARETEAAPIPEQEEPTKGVEAVSVPKERIPAEEAGVVLVPKQKVSSDGTKMAPPPREDGKWVCPIGGCREPATHLLDECNIFKDLTLTKRQKALKERGLCECCLTDCRDRETGTRDRNEVLPVDWLPTTSAAEIGRAAGANLDQQGGTKRRPVAEQSCGKRPAAQGHPP
jgi:hypothetical protein